MPRTHQGLIMLTELQVTFSTRATAQHALTDFRKRYRIALRGACITGPHFRGEYRVHVPLGGTGFSNAEMSAELRAGNY
jgi:hypothetical protein